MYILQVKKVFSFRQEVISCLKVLARLYPDEVMEAVVLSRLQWNAGNEYHNIVVYTITLLLRKTDGYTLSECKRNEEIVRELQIPQITEFLKEYVRNWKESIDRIPKEILKYQPKRKRSSGRCLKLWKDFIL
jgi:hypothetical protein